ncbi:MAG: radical SAM protein [Candidatus Margulisiibacteriota bacterium]
MIEAQKRFKYIYGPVPSWRLGRSLGVDLVSGEKACPFECIYCQLGKTINHSKERRIFNPMEEIIKELESLPVLEIDYITLSGTGEPTLALNLGEVILEIKKRFKSPLAVLTNSVFLSDAAVRKELSPADLIVAKLDAVNDETLAMINRPAERTLFDDILKGIKAFNSEYPNKLALQIMFMPQNKRYAPLLGSLAKQINPVEVQVNTPLRPCPVKPLSPEELKKIKEFFDPLKSYSVYDMPRPGAEPMDIEQTKKRRPVI